MRIRSPLASDHPVSPSLEYYQQGASSRAVSSQWAGAPLIAFAVQTCTRWASQVEMFDAQIGHLLYARSSVIQQEEQDAITQRPPATRRQPREQRRHFVALPIAGLRRCSPLGGNGRDPLADIEHLGQPSRQIAEEHVDRGKSLARSNETRSRRESTSHQTERGRKGEAAWEGRLSQVARGRQSASG